MGFSQWGINCTLNFLDTTDENALVVFPTFDSASIFSNSRFKPVIEESPYLQSIVTGLDNVGVKQVGTNFLYFRGSERRIHLKQIPAGFLMLDELDEMMLDNIPLAEARLDASKHKMVRKLSTPTYPGMGINAEYEKGDQRHWFIKCEGCNERQSLTWKDNFVAEPKPEYVCKKCKKPIDRLMDGEWVATYQNREIHSYHISQMHSPRITPYDLYLKSIRTRNVQEFYNSNLGEPFSPKGAQLDFDTMNACVLPGWHLQAKGEKSFMGVDVGSKLHTVIGEFKKLGDENNKQEKLVITHIGSYNTFDELEVLMRDYDVSVAVIDALPETREVARFCDRFAGRAFAAYYTSQKEYTKWEERRVLVNRTLSLDYMFDRYMTRNLALPEEWAEIDEFKDHMVALKRVVNKKEDSNDKEITVEYVHGEAPDHYAHASNYMEIGSSKGGFRGLLEFYQMGSESSPSEGMTPEQLAFVKKVQEEGQPIGG